MDLRIGMWAIPAIAAIVLAGILFFIRSIAFKVLHKWADRSQTRVDDLIIESLKTPSIYWCLAIGLYVGVGISEIPERYVSYIKKTIDIIVILSITIASANLTGQAFRNYIRKSAIPIPATGLADGILRGTILVVGFLIILTTLGISIAPLLTALGVGGLAVALALQDTISNLFAGIHILLGEGCKDRRFRKA